MEGVQDGKGGGPGAFVLPQKEKLKQPCPSGSSPGPSPADSGSARPHVRQPWQQHRGHALQRRLLERRLLMAVSLWMGDVVLPCTPRRPATHTRGIALQPLREPAVGPGLGEEGALEVSFEKCAWKGVGFASVLLLSTWWSVQEVARHSGLSRGISGSGTCVQVYVPESWLRCLSRLTIDLWRSGVPVPRV